MNVRQLGESDLPALLALDAQTNAHAWSAAQWQDSLRDHLCLGLEVAGQLLAYVVAMRLPAEAEILLIAVQPEHQGSGLGKKLLQELMQVLQQEHCEQIFLEVRASNSQAQHFYAANGFKAVGRRKNYYPQQYGREDALLYALQSGDAAV